MEGLFSKEFRRNLREARLRIALTSGLKLGSEPPRGSALSKMVVDFDPFVRSEEP